MGQFPSQYNDVNPYAYGQTNVDAGVMTKFFNAVYAWMASGLALTAVVAYWIGTQTDLHIGMGTVWLLFIVEIGLVIAVSGAINKISANVATLLFLLYAALNGVTLSFIFKAFSQGSIASAFIITAGMFAAMSVYGFTTGRDLTRIGSLCFMGLIGIILASVVSFFIPMGGLVTAINYIGVLVFVGLTAYYTQALKQIALQTQNNAAMAARLSIVGALSLYLAFLNLFLFILQIMGDGRRR
jgi:hypothetical protein